MADDMVDNSNTRPTKTCRVGTSSSRRLGKRPEQVMVKKDKEDGDHVDLHPCKNQVIITVNTPEGFKLSLDYLPCFQHPPEELARAESPLQGGWIAGSSSGLLLCTTGKFLQTQYYLCNPVTKQWISLPRPPKTHKCVHIGFVFVPCSDNCQKKLHCRACRFMVVRFDEKSQCYFPRNVFEVESFSSETNQWTIDTASSSKEPFYWAGDPLSLGAIFYNGCFHWNTVGCEIVVYDPYKRMFMGHIRGPVLDGTCLINEDHGSLCLSQGSFWLCHYGNRSLDIRLWKLNGYDDSSNLNQCYWSVQHQLNLRDMTCRFNWGPSPRCGPMLDIHPNDPDIIFMQFGRGMKFFVFSCNFRTKTLGRLRLAHQQVRFPGDVFTLVLPLPDKATATMGLV